MRLNVIVEDRTQVVEVPDHVLEEGEEFFAKMDRDMDGGWQMSRVWVDSPTPLDRCQIAADRLLTALEAGNDAMKLLMAGYILARMPGATGVRISTEGEMQETEILTGG
jgi:hypothetical protein